MFSTLSKVYIVLYCNFTKFGGLARLFFLIIKNKTAEVKHILILVLNMDQAPKSLDPTIPIIQT